ncbi:MAG: hypothetical protein AAFY72_11250 [Cyanobacteria bacterium J06649_4]
MGFLSAPDVAPLPATSSEAGVSVIRRFKGLWIPLLIIVGLGLSLLLAFQPLYAATTSTAAYSG